jgi:hypothetical protein
VGFLENLLMKETEYEFGEERRETLPTDAM